MRSGGSTHLTSFVIWIFVLVIIYTLVDSFVDGYRGKPTMPTHICAECGTRCSNVRSRRAGWTFLFFPLNIVVATKKPQNCAACQGRLIPVTSPKGKELTR